MADVKRQTQLTRGGGVRCQVGPHHPEEHAVPTTASSPLDTLRSLSPSRKPVSPGHSGSAMTGKAEIEHPDRVGTVIRTPRQVREVFRALTDLPDLPDLLDLADRRDRLRLERARGDSGVASAWIVRPTPGEDQDRARGRSETSEGSDAGEGTRRVPGLATRRSPTGSG